MPNMLISTGRALLGPEQAIPEFRDEFTRGDGSVGNGWTGATWAISSNGIVNTPTFSAGEIFADTGLEAAYVGGKCNTLSMGGAPALAQSANVHGGAKAQEFIAGAAADRLNWGTPAPTATEWYRFSAWGIRTAGAKGGTALNLSGGGGAGSGTGVRYTDAAYTQKFLTYQALTAAALVPYICYEVGAGAGDTVTVDDGSLMKYDYASMFMARRYSARDVIVGATMSGRSYGQAGIVVALDSATNPQSYVVGYSDGTNLKLDQVVNRVVTNKIIVTHASSSYYTWYDGELLEVRRSGNTYQLWYRGTQVGADQTITDAAIVNNRFVGTYSQDTTTKFDSFSAREYAAEVPPYTWTGFTPQTYTPGQAVIALRFDDGPSADSSYVAVQLDARSLVGSFTWIRAQIGTTGKATLAQGLAMQTTGHEIMCHGLTHANITSDAMFIAETSVAADEMRRIGFNIYSFIQPGTWTTRNLDGSDWGQVGGAMDQYLRRFFNVYMAYMVSGTGVPVSSYVLPYATHYGPLPSADTSVCGRSYAQNKAFLDDMIVNGTGAVLTWHALLLDTYDAAVNIASSTDASPIEITTAAPHGLTATSTVLVENHTVNTNANGQWDIGFVNATKFTLTGSLATGGGDGGADGTIKALAGMTKVDFEALLDDMETAVTAGDLKVVTVSQLLLAQPA